MRIISAIICLVLVIGFSVCANGSQTSTNTPVRLTPEMFTGYEFTLISDTDYVEYFFSSDKSVDASFGGKGKHDGVVALLFGWKIKGGHTLVFTSSALGDGEERYSLQFKSFGQKMVVTMDGQKFRRSKVKYPN